MVWFRERSVQHFKWQVAAANDDSRAFWRVMDGREVMIRMRMDLGDGYDD